MNYKKENEQFMLVLVNKDENYMKPVALDNEQTKLLNNFIEKLYKCSGYLNVVDKKYPRKVKIGKLNT